MFPDKAVITINTTLGIQLTVGFGAEEKSDKNVDLISQPSTSEK